MSQGGEVVGGAAVGADDVVVVAAGREPVLGGAVVEHDLAERADVLKQPQRAEDRRATDPGGGVQERVRGEVIAELAHRADQGAPRLGEAVTGPGESQLEGLRGDHAVAFRARDIIVVAAARVCQRGSRGLACRRRLATDWAVLAGIRHNERVKPSLGLLGLFRSPGSLSVRGSGAPR